MRVGKRGSGLAVRIPSAVVNALDLKPGDQVHVAMTGEKKLEITKAPERHPSTDDNAKAGR